MLLRLAIVLLFIVAGTAAFAGLRRWHMGRITAVAAPNALPTLLYFASETCLVCPAQEQHVQMAMVDWNGRLSLQKINVDHEPDKATRYGILSLPTTILLDSSGSVQQINYGLTNAHKLRSQFKSLNESKIFGD